MESAWNSIARKYAAELNTTCEDVHFGVGIPGNQQLGIVPTVTSGVAIDLGCGSGENLVALHRLGYSPIGIDSSELQLSLARELLQNRSLECPLIKSDVCTITSTQPLRSADLILTVGVAHFCSSIVDFISLCASLLKTAGDLVLSVPHPVDMITQIGNQNGKNEIVLDSYYPLDGTIRNAHYWRRFAGRLSIADGLIEYLWRPSQLVNTLVDCGFEVRGMWEPEYTNGENVPCSFRNADPWFAEQFCRRVPQYMIVRATLRKRRERL